MKYTLLAALLIAASIPAYAQVDPALAAENINTVLLSQQAARDAAQAQADAAAAAERTEQMQAQAREQARQDRISAGFAAAARARAANVAAVQAHAQSRAESQEDEDRALKIQEEKIRLQTMQTDANRENDIVNAQIRNADAHTAVVQSKANATNNVSKGVESNLTATGNASLAKASKWFGSN